MSLSRNKAGRQSYYAKHKDVARRYYLRNRERILAYQKIYNEANKERLQANRVKNRLKINERNRKYWEGYKHAYNALRRTRYNQLKLEEKKND